MKRNGVGFRIAQGGTLTFAAAVLMFVVVQAQGGCKGDVTAEPEPTDEASPAKTAATSTAVEAKPSSEPTSTGAGASAPEASATAAPKTTATTPTKPGAVNPAPNAAPKREFLPSTKAGVMPPLLDEPSPQQVQK